MPDPLADRMAVALIEAYEDWERVGLSTLGVRRGLGERMGVIRLTVDDVSRICARVAREETADA